LSDPGAKLRELAARYQLSLGPKLVAIQAAWKRSQTGDPGGLTELGELIHKLRGSAGTYGFHEISIIAGRAEDVIDPMLATNARDDIALAEVAAHLLELQRAIQNEHMATATDIRSPILNLGTATATDNRLRMQAADDHDDATVKVAIHKQSNRDLILIVDDDPDVRDRLVALLEDRGYDVAAFGAGEPALRFAGVLRPSLVLLDLGLPTIDGFETLRQLHQVTKMDKVPVIVLSARNSEESMLQAYQLGVSDYVTKPYSDAELMAKLRNALVKRRQAREISRESYAPGKLLDGRFRVLSRIGFGGMGLVLRVNDEKDNSVKALKLLEVKLDDEREIAAQRFEREIEAMTSLTHPHIVPVLYSGHLEDTPFYVMPCLNGGTFCKRAYAEPPELLQGLRDLIPIAEAVQSIHEVGLIHRDIKADNVLYDDNDVPFLSDFGLVRALSERYSRLTEQGFAVGTPRYMSPEMLAEKGELDERCDIYALGVLVYELATGTLPYAEKTRLQALVATATGVPPIPPRRLRPDCPFGVEQLCYDAMAYDRDKRIQTAAEVVQRLAKLVTLLS